MSHKTTNLGLHIWDIPADNKQQFDYLKAVAENFKAIDDKAGEDNTDIEELRTKVSNIEEEQETQNSDISVLQERVQLLENSQIRGISDKDESITITDVAKMYGKLEVEGNTKQDGTPTPQNAVEIKNCKDSINIRLQNKNHVVLNEDAFKFGNALGKYAKINEDGTITTTSNYSNSRDKGTEMYLKKNTEYEVSVYVNSIVTDSNVKNVQLEILAYDASNKFIIPLSKTISETGKLTTYTFNSQDYKRVGVCVSGWFGAGQSGSTTYSKLMVREKNTTDNAYVEGAYKKIVFPLKSGQVLRKGDYLADDGVHSKRGQVVVNGTELIYSLKLEDNGLVAFNLQKTGIVNSSGNNIIQYCNILTSEYFRGWSAMSNASTKGIATYTGQFRARIDNVFGITAEDTDEQKETKLKNYLQENNIVAEMDLSEEVVEEYTEEQQNVYNELKNLLYFQGYNYISSQDETSPIMQAFYIVDINTKLASISSRLTNVESSTEVAQ